ncbi:MAG: hypothetical protein O4965_29080 [Trichodesmium sp. St19_bin1]|nr:hypothetical protein [Trichodesmium sp. St19_bin1]
MQFEQRSNKAVPQNIQNLAFGESHISSGGVPEVQQIGQNFKVSEEETGYFDDSAGLIATGMDSIDAT